MIVYTYLLNLTSCQTKYILVLLKIQHMISMTVHTFKEKFSDVIGTVQNGKENEVAFGKKSILSVTLNQILNLNFIANFRL